MAKNIINRVKKSGIITIDLDDVNIPDNLFEIDIKNCMKVNQKWYGEFK